MRVIELYNPRMKIIGTSKPKSALNDEWNSLLAVRNADFAVGRFFGILFALDPVAGRIF
jgi:hypothetical protein